MTIKFGVTCGGDHWSDDDIRAVEEHGYDSFWTGEHIVYHRPILESTTILTHAAALTSRIKIGPATLILPLRHPTIVAKEYSCLDVLSGGRAVLTIGVGGDYPREFEACGVPMNERGRRATEALEIIRKYWSGERFDYDGKIYQLKTPTCCRRRSSRAASRSGYRGARTGRCAAPPASATAGTRTCTPPIAAGNRS